jgi:hypothetical protein
MPISSTPQNGMDWSSVSAGIDVITFMVAPVPAGRSVR